MAGSPDRGHVLSMTNDRLFTISVIALGTLTVVLTTAVLFWK
jgi:hypothetical protein